MAQRPLVLHAISLQDSGPHQMLSATHTRSTPSMERTAGSTIQIFSVRPVTTVITFPDTHLRVIITRFPINPDGRLTDTESEAEILFQDLDNNRSPKGLPKHRKGHKHTFSLGAAYLARWTIALLRDAIDLDTAQRVWETEPNVISGSSAFCATNGPRTAGRGLHRRLLHVAVGHVTSAHLPSNLSIPP